MLYIYYHRIRPQKKIFLCVAYLSCREVHHVFSSFRDIYVTEKNITNLSPQDGTCTNLCHERKDYVGLTG